MEQSERRRAQQYAKYDKEAAMAEAKLRDQEEKEIEERRAAEQHEVDRIEEERWVAELQAVSG